jgi:hypothetical protein
MECLFSRCVVLLLMLAPLSARAVWFDPLSIESLTRQADVVVQGTVLSETCQRDSAGRIYTMVELQVTDLWKGAVPGSPFVIVHGGGRLGDRQSRVGGEVKYQVGEEVVAFLVWNSRGQAVTVGLMQGKFHVWRDPLTGSRFVVNPFHGVPEQAAPPMRIQDTSRPSADSPAPLALAELKKRVLEANR